MKISGERLMEALSYDRATGIFRWKIPRSNYPAGRIAGTPHKGYVAIVLDGAQYKAHRLAWLYEYGVWPAGQIDHINGVKNDNRIENLRLATPQANKQNIRAAQRNNKLGLLGVHWCEKTRRFKAAIGHNGKTMHLGCFMTAEEAHASYVAAKREMHADGCTL